MIGQRCATDHPIITSFEPGERWFYDYPTEQFFTGPKLHARIRWINRCPDRPEGCLQTGKRCFTNRGQLFGSAASHAVEISASQGRGLRIRPVRDTRVGPTTGARRAAKPNSVIATPCFSGDHVGVRLVVPVIQHSRYPQSGRVP